MPDAPLCVQCRQRSIDPKWRPFCSERCKLTDLGRWLQGDYRVPGPPVDDVSSPADDPDEADPAAR